MKSLVLAVSLFLAPLGASASTLDGTWQVKGSVQGNSVNPVCVLAEKDGKLSGTCTGTDGKLVPLKGTLTGKEVKWQYDTQYQADGITLFFTGKLEGEDHLTGTIYVEPFAVDGGFTATKDKPTAPGAPPVPVPPPAS